LKKSAHRRHTDHLTEASRNSHRGILVWNVLLAVFDHLPTQLRILLSHLRTQTLDPCGPNILPCRSHRRRCSSQLRYTPCRPLHSRNRRRWPHRPDRNRRHGPRPPPHPRQMVWHYQRHVVTRIRYRPHHWWRICPRGLVALDLLHQPAHHRRCLYLRPVVP